uniref:PABS domain-containing protein n=1 Tax=Strigamia maritima TaxID=126957 RepID=T1IY40_STRMM
MAAHTTMLDFHLDTAIIENPDDADNAQQQFTSILSKWEFEQQMMIDTNPGFIIFYKGSNETHGVVRVYSDGYSTVTLEEGMSCKQASGLSAIAEASKAIQEMIVDKLKLSKSKSYLPMKRGGPIDQFITTSDNRLVEYDFDEVVYEGTSPYQTIKILHSCSFGNMLVLDDLQNIAESDLIYTHTIMRHGIENYKGKEILILGGGDGGLLCELLKEDPKFMCKDMIIVDDCFKALKKYIKEERTFDYVFGDLTDIPITPTPHGEFWDFMREVLELTLQILAPNGKYLTHGTGLNSVHPQKMYEEELRQRSVPVRFNKFSAHIPSFLETWVFYEIWKGDINDANDEFEGADKLTPTVRKFQIITFVRRIII